MKKNTILFQGDSITDGNRGRSEDPNHILGHGYAYIAAARLGFNHPEKNYHFINRGISGNTAPDLYARWQEDALYLMPEVISILVGINDASMEKRAPEGMGKSKYEETLRLIISQTKELLPETRFILMEPFIMKTGNLEDSEYEKLYEKLIKKQEAVHNIVEEFSPVYVPLQKRFDDAAKIKPVDYWIWDSVHPTYSGHGLIADAWLNDTKTLFE